MFLTMPACCHFHLQTCQQDVHSCKHTSCRKWNCRIFWASATYCEGSLGYPPWGSSELSSNYCAYTYNRIKQNASIVCQSLHLKRFQFVPFAPLPHSQSTASSGRKAICSRMTCIFSTYVTSVNTTHSQLFGEDEDDQGELDEALKQGENGKPWLYAG